MHAKELMQLTAEFLARIQGINCPEPQVFTIAELRNLQQTLKPKNIPWARSPGIYWFWKDGIIQYVGRATKNVGLWNRVRNQINSYGDVNWDRIILDDQAKCGIMCFDLDDWYWVGSLELYLIEQLKPPICKRGG